VIFIHLIPMIAEQLFMTSMSILTTYPYPEPYWKPGVNEYITTNFAETHNKAQ
jgi:hypothetical protein